MILYTLSPVYDIIPVMNALAKKDKREMQVSMSSGSRQNRKYTIGIYVKNTAEGDKIQAFVDGMLYNSPY